MSGSGPPYAEKAVIHDCDFSSKTPGVTSILKFRFEEIFFPERESIRNRLCNFLSRAWDNTLKSNTEKFPWQNIWIFTLSGIKTVYNSNTSFQVKFSPKGILVPTFPPTPQKLVFRALGDLQLHNGRINRTQLSGYGNHHYPQVCSPRFTWGQPQL